MAAPCEIDSGELQMVFEAIKCFKAIATAGNSGTCGFSGRPKVQQRNPLSAQSKMEQSHQIGSLRDVATSVERVPGHLVVGGKVRELLETYLSETPGLEDGFVSAIGGGTAA